MRPSQQKRSSCAFVHPTWVEGLEQRLLLAVNAWKTGVSGNWNDATKWSLGHFPTTSEEVSITVAGNYTVTVPNVAATPYFYANSLTLGTGATGVQKLVVNAYMIINKAFHVGVGDSIDIFAGRFNASTPAGTLCQIDGTISMNGVSGKTSYLTTSGANMVGAGSIVFATGGANSLGVNLLTSNGSVMSAAMTLRGKGGTLQGSSFTNKGAIKLEGGTTDFWSLTGVSNQGAFTSPGGSNITLYNLANTAGRTISVTGGVLAFKGTYSNAGTISATNTKLTYGMTFTAAGTVNRTNSPVLFSGILNGNGGALKPGDAAGQWTWTGGTLLNGSYDPSLPTALKMDPTAINGSYGTLDKVTLIGDLPIRGGFSVNAYNTLTLSTGRKVILNGTTTTGRAAIYINNTTLSGSGEIVFNTAGNNLTVNLVGGAGWTLGSSILVHGKSGQIQGLTNSGTILADTAGETIQINSITNNGNIIAAPGTIRVQSFKQNSGGALTVGIGGTTAGTSFGKFVFFDAIIAPALSGTFNVVRLNGYLPVTGAIFAVATFAKPPTGAFTILNLDSGNAKAFDATITTTGISLKAKISTNTFANRDASGNLKILGTTGIDTIVDKLAGYIHYATLNGKTSVFFSPQIISLTLDGGDNNDTLTNNGGMGAKIFGGKGNDVLIGGSANDSLDGGEGNDSLTGNAGNDLMIGGLGNDSMVGSSGDDTYSFSATTIVETDLINEGASAGLDTLDFSTLASTIAVKVTLGSDTLATHTNRTVKTQVAGQWANLENAKGGAGNDSITGNSAANKLYGGAGNDTMDGSAGNDSMWGDLGDDRLTGGTGLDSIQGNDGVDTFFVLDGLKDFIDGGTSVDIVSSSDSIDVKTNI